MLIISEKFVERQIVCYQASEKGSQKQENTKQHSQREGYFMQASGNETCFADSFRVSRRNFP